ncbi:unnamed protein product (macronuclear) [Paramecium tetraurelia]|uniref:Uncharacterized protein n=1 Tax=Paramecium tetraurelia TaxID=5888 RepID=A0DH52_PARTE|nr:uncharacterized protein GSPATT00016755001 [Paramecium tetraurelia]CAK82369.1 unnamed protein product [Paramecium tetraurelia]|eukprot:XP_001449766.1 hypothetical protein (macronuclear) [Paramecium tetraurelia strain d4-2]
MFGSQCPFSSQTAILVSVYCGFNPTGHSFLLGNFVSILNLEKLAQLDFFQPIAIVGYATIQLGYPSFKMKQSKRSDLIAIQENFYTKIGINQDARIGILQIMGQWNNHYQSRIPWFFRDGKLIDLVSIFRMISLLNKDHIFKGFNNGDDSFNCTKL